jgi:hypothetical protein
VGLLSDCLGIVAGLRGEQGCFYMPVAAATSEAGKSWLAKYFPLVLTLHFGQF